MISAKSRMLVETLKQDILSGKYGSEQPFPSRRALARRFGLAGTTVQRALEELAHRGLIAQSQGRGSVVTRIGASRKIGIIIPGICYSEIFPPMCKELSRLAQKEGYTLLFGDLSSSDPKVRAKRARELALQFTEERVAGVLFQPIEFVRNADGFNQGILSVFDEAGIPVVLLDCDIVAAPVRSDYDVVGINNHEAGWRLAQHLLDVGVRHVRFLTKPNSDHSVQNRVNGVKYGMTSANGTFSVIDIDPSDVDSVRRLFKAKPLPEAILCRNDGLAARLLVTLREIGKGVPEDVLVAGFNDVTYATIVEPALTTIHIPPEDMANKAFYVLLDRIAHPSRPKVEVYLSAPLVVRRSTERAVRKGRKTARGACAAASGKSDLNVNKTRRGKR